MPVRPKPLAVGGYRRWAALMTLVSLILTVAGLYELLQGRYLTGAAGLVLGVAVLYLIQRLQIQTEPGSDWELVFVTKAECSLCEEARALLDATIANTPFRVREVHIEEDRLMRRHFRHRVPVLLWQAEVLQDLRWDPGALSSRLAQIQATRARPPGTA